LRLRVQIPSDAVLAATKPRGLRLFTQRTAIRFPWPPRPEQLTGWLEHWLRRSRCQNLAAERQRRFYRLPRQSPVCHPDTVESSGQGGVSQFRLRRIRDKTWRRHQPLSAARHWNSVCRAAGEQSGWRSGRRAGLFAARMGLLPPSWVVRQLPQRLAPAKVADPVGSGTWVRSHHACFR